MASESMSVVNGNINCTLINGTIVSIPRPGQSGYHAVETETKTDDSYDAPGAMKFIIATVLVYSIFGVFCTLLTRIKRGRGRGNSSYLQDEMVWKYIKAEKILKIDGQKMKLMYDNQLMIERLKHYDEKIKLLQLEKDIESDFSLEKTDFKSNNNKAKKKHDVASTVGIMGMSLFHVNCTPNKQNNNQMEKSPTPIPTKTNQDERLFGFNQEKRPTHTNLETTEEEGNALDDDYLHDTLTESECVTHNFLETDV